MGLSKNTPRLIKAEYGFYQYSPLPSEEELRNYYAEKYYQEGHGSYSVEYTDEEIEYFKLKASLIYRKASQLMDMEKTKSFIDVGCGEGWVLNEFNQRGHVVLGIDFSRHGLETFHPHLLISFEQGNIYALLKQKTESEIRFDIVLLANIVEHVVDPVKLLQKVKKIMSKEALLIIVAPNDFSPLHEHLLEQKKITKEFWLCYPDHLSYFNKESMDNLLSSLGFKVHAVVADNPVDLNLLNDNSNYVEDPSKGKITHLFRVRNDNFLASLDRDKLLEIYEILGSMGVGRDLSYYCSITK